MNTIRTIALASCLLVIVIPADRPAHAQSEEYEATVDDAVALLDAQRWPEAYAMFTRAHELRPSARTLRGQGLAAYGMNHFVEAARLLEASINDPRNPLTPDVRQTAERLLARCQAAISRIELVITVPNAAASVDGHPVDHTSELQLDPGEHFISVDAPRHAQATRSVTLTSGERRVVHVVLQPIPEPTVVAQPISEPPVARETTTPTVTQSPPAHTEQPLEDEPASSTSSRSPAFSVGAAAVGLGGASLVVGVVSHALRVDAGNAFDDSVSMGTCVAVDANGDLPVQPDPRCTDWHNRRSRLRAPMLVGYVGAGLFAGLGVVLMVIGRGGDDSSSAAIACGAGPGDVGVSCAGHF